MNRQSYSLKWPGLTAQALSTTLWHNIGRVQTSAVQHLKRSMMMTFASGIGCTIMTSRNQTYERVRHPLGQQHVIVRKVQTNGDMEIIMYTDPEPGYIKRWKEGDSYESRWFHES
jgi:hypothetical protein